MEVSDLGLACHRVLYISQVYVRLRHIQFVLGLRQLVSYERVHLESLSVLPFLPFDPALEQVQLFARGALIDDLVLNVTQKGLQIGRQRVKHSVIEGHIFVRLAAALARLPQPLEKHHRASCSLELLERGQGGQSVGLGCQLAQKEHVAPARQLQVSLLESEGCSVLLGLLCEILLSLERCMRHHGRGRVCLQAAQLGLDRFQLLSQGTIQSITGVL